MSVAVLIPWRGGCPHRERALEWVLARYIRAGWPVRLGEPPAGPWCKAQAVAAALKRTDADVLVIADADVWVDGLLPAVEIVQAGTLHATPHRSVHRLSEGSTLLVLAGENPEGMALAERAYRGVQGGGIVVVRREVYEQTPLDARFTGWGGEDESWGMALRTLHGPGWRPKGHAPLWHCWHPPPLRATRSFGSLAGRDRRKLYVRANNDAAAMRRLVEEGSLALRSLDLPGRGLPSRAEREDSVRVPERSVEPERDDRQPVGG